MRVLTALLAAIVLAAGAGSSPGGETYGNYTTMGVIVDCPSDIVPGDVARARVYLLDEGARIPMHDLVRVGSESCFAGTLFRLEPGRAYTVEVTLRDREGKALHVETLTGRTRREPLLRAARNALYVSPSGDDAAAGTMERPLRTFTAGVAKLQPGMTLFLREGRYYEGDLTLAKRGAPDAPIVIRAYEKERPILDGSDPSLVDADWQRGNADTWSAAFEGNTWAVTAEHKVSGKFYRLYPLRMLEDLASRQSAGKTFEQLGFTGAYHCDGKRIHVVTPGGSSADYRFHVSLRTRALDLEDAAHVFIDGVDFRHYGRRGYGAAIGVLNSPECVVQNCRVLYANSGVWLKGASSNVTVQDCEFVDDLFHWHFGYAKTGDGWAYHGQIETGAVAVDGVYTGRGLVVRRNRMEGLFDGSRICPWVEVAKTGETDFFDNVMDSISDDFLETDGFSRNVRIVGNRMSKSLSGISLAQALDGPTWILYNAIIDCGVSPATSLEDYEGYPFKTNGGPQPEVGSGPVFFYHNTAWTSDPRSRALLVKSNVRWRLFVLYNNIWCGKAMGFDKWSGPLSPMDWDYDDVWHEAGPFMKHEKKVYPGLAEVRVAFGVLPHGMSADPKFVAPEKGDFSLLPGSPCIDAGVVLDGINTERYSGAAPDMGAFESGK
jgi:hypothetical protein